MKITKRQLKRIIKEERQKLLREQAEDEMYLAREDLPELLDAIEYNKEMAMTGDMDDTYESDAFQLQNIYDMSKVAIDKGTLPSSQLRNYISRLDTVVREQIPLNLYNWIVGQRDY